MNLQLSLKTQWFEMTKAGIKTEDYREINEYWCRRLLFYNRQLEHDSFVEMCEDLADQNRKHADIGDCMNFFDVMFKYFEYNIMTLGYPKSTDFERILKYKHEGITIGYGKEEFGAESNKLYFVIKHGEQIK